MNFQYSDVPGPQHTFPHPPRSIAQGSPWANQSSWSQSPWTTPPPPWSAPPPGTIPPQEFAANQPQALTLHPDQSLKRQLDSALRKIHEYEDACLFCSLYEWMYLCKSHFSCQCFITPPSVVISSTRSKLSTASFAQTANKKSHIHAYHQVIPGFRPLSFNLQWAHAIIDHHPTWAAIQPVFKQPRVILPLANLCPPPSTIPVLKPPRGQSYQVSPFLLNSYPFLNSLSLVNPTNNFSRPSARRNRANEYPNVRFASPVTSHFHPPPSPSSSDSSTVFIPSSPDSSASDSGFALLNRPATIPNTNQGPEQSLSPRVALPHLRQPPSPVPIFWRTSEQESEAVWSTTYTTRVRREVDVDSVRSLQIGSEPSIRSLKFSDDGKTLAVGYDDTGMTNVYDLQSGEKIRFSWTWVFSAQVLINLLYQHDEGHHRRKRCPHQFSLLLARRPASSDSRFRWYSPCKPLRLSNPNIPLSFLFRSGRSPKNAFGTSSNSHPNLSPASTSPRTAVTSPWASYSPASSASAACTSGIGVTVLERSPKTQFRTLTTFDSARTDRTSRSAWTAACCCGTYVDGAPCRRR